MIPAFRWQLFLTRPPGSRQLPFGPGRHRSRYTASYATTTVMEGSGLLSSFSCRLSAAAISFLAVLSRHPYPLPSRSAYRRLINFHRRMTGFPCSALLRCDRCRAPPIPRDRGAHVADQKTSATTAASQRRVLFLGRAPTHPRFVLTRLTEVHVIRPHPVFPSPVTGEWVTGPWASSQASHPAVTSDACRERGRALSTRPELTVDHDRPSLSANSLTTVRPHVAPSAPRGRRRCCCPGASG
jgi:hypothetical protein